MKELLKEERIIQQMVHGGEKELQVGTADFFKFIYLFIYGCVGSSFLCEGFL